MTRINLIQRALLLKLVSTCILKLDLFALCSSQHLLMSLQLFCPSYRAGRELFSEKNPDYRLPICTSNFLWPSINRSNLFNSSRTILSFNLSFEFSDFAIFIHSLISVSE